MNDQVSAPSGFSDPAARCRVEMLGGLRLMVAGATVTRFSTRKTSGLLSYLALALPRPQSRDVLAEMFWPEQETEAARNSLRVALASLRRQLEPPVPGGKTTGQVPILVTDRTQAGLNPAAVSTDVAEFERALDGIGRRDSPPEVRAALMERAAALYQGELLPGYYDDWAIQRQTRLQSRFLETLRQWADERAAAGDTEAAAVAADRAARLDPYDESLLRSRVRLHLAAGRRTRAREIYDEAVERWKREFGAALSAESRRLEEDLQPPGRDSTAGASARRWATQARAEPPVPPVAAAPSAPSAPSTLAARPGLPLPLTRFFGREDETARLVALLGGRRSGADRRDHDDRLVTLTGPGGTGKTRLAIEAARAVADRFDQVCFVPLADLTDPRRMPDRVAEALGIAMLPADAGEALDRIASEIGSHRMLLILDNLEQLLAAVDAKARRRPQPSTGEGFADGAAFVHALLQRLPALTVLCTSRRRLSLRGEREYPVSPLPVPEDHGAATPGALLAYAGVQVYLDRAQAARPDFQVTTGNAESVARLCRLLEGNPLALELAAAWVRTLPPAPMLRRLQGSTEAGTAASSTTPASGSVLALPGTRERDVPDRHHSLRATLDWSYHLLSPQQQRLFARLSVFVGGWTVEAAAAVCHEPDALEVLAELESASLVRVVPPPETEEDGEPRYHFLELVRAYAAERLNEEAEPDRQRRRHRDFFRDLVRDAEPHFYAADRSAEVRRRVTAELDNIRRMLDGYQADWSPGIAEALLEMIAALQMFWLTHGHLREGRERSEAALRRPDTAASALSAEGIGNRLVILRGLFNIAVHQGDADAAYRFNEECRELLMTFRPEDRLGQGRIAFARGNVEMMRGDHEAAGRSFQEALSILSAVEGARLDVAALLEATGALAALRGDPTRARIRFAESAEEYRALGMPDFLAHGLSGVASMAYALGDFAAARAAARECLQICLELDSRRDVRYALVTLARVLRNDGDYRTAARLFGAEEAQSESEDASAWIDPPLDRAARETEAALLGAGLSKPDLAEAWAAGRRLSWQEAVRAALDA